MKKQLGILGLALILLTTGCGGGHMTVPQAHFGQVHRVAIIPFENFTGQGNDAGSKLTSIFTTKLCQTNPIEVASMGEVERFLREERIRSISDMDLSTIKKMGEKLGIQAIILGTVNEYGHLSIKGENTPVVGVSIRVVDVNTGRAGWGVTHSREGKDGEIVFGFGKITSLNRLADLVMEEIADAFKQSIKLAEAKAEESFAVEQKNETIDKIPSADKTSTVIKDDKAVEKEKTRERAKQLWEKYKTKSKWF